jgi:hypothetical protein
MFRYLLESGDAPSQPERLQELGDLLFRGIGKYFR